MLIATLGRMNTPAGGIVYYATDPFDGELLTRFHDTIMQVDQDLQEHDQQWGLNTGAYAGESDVPARISDDNTEDTEGRGSPCGCDSFLCEGLSLVEGQNN